MNENPPGVVAVPIRVRYGETDQMGHAYYANYLLWFEVARGEWCRAHGFTYKSLEESGYKLPVVEAWAKYRGEVKYDDDIHVRIWLAEVKRSAMKFAYSVLNLTTGQVTTEGFTWHVLVREGEMKAISIPPEIREQLGEATEQPF
ncbi:MAG: acyl-CoA thioesterase [Fimbriimonadaceae bacterium]|nr:acyl-CoA thioesterase [Fimbriimonadaceae bacterium]